MTKVVATILAVGVSLALLFTWASEAEAAVVYFDDRLVACGSTYDPTDGTCGAGAAESVQLWSELETWLTANGGVANTVYLSGGATLGARHRIQLESTSLPNYSLNLSGAQCSAGLTITPNPSLPFHEITAAEDATGWAWYSAYPASDDFPANYGNVWAVNQPENFTVGGKFPLVIQEGSVDLVDDIIAHYDAGTLREWDPRTGMRWKDSIGNVRNAEQTVIKFGHFYTAFGYMYYLPAQDSGTFNQYFNGEARTLWWSPPGKRFLRTDKCVDVVLDELRIDKTDAIWVSTGDTRSVLRDSVIGRAVIGYQYSPIKFDKATDNTWGTANRVVNNYFVLTGGHHAGHRGGALNAEKQNNFHESGNKFIMAGGHGSYLWDVGTDFSMIGSEHWGTGGKSPASAGIDGGIMIGNSQQFMFHTWCNYANTPTGDPSGDAGLCPQEWNSNGINQDENHYAFSFDGKQVLALDNWMYGLSGGMSFSGRKNGVNQDGGRNRDSRAIHNVFYKTEKGNFTGSGVNKTEFGRVFNLYDGPGNQPGPIWDFRAVNNMFMEHTGRGWTQDKHEFIKVSLLLEPGSNTLVARDITFEGNMIVSAANDGTETHYNSSRNCTDFAALTNVTDTTCSAIEVPVVSYPGNELPNVDLRPTDGTGAQIDQGVAVATATTTGSSDTALVVSDIYAFPDPSMIDSSAQADAAANYNTVYCGEATCDDAGNPGRVPDANWIADPGVPAGEFYVQIGTGTRTTYDTWTYSGSGTVGTLTLTAAQSWTSGDTVSPTPWAGTAPDPGAQYFATINSLVANDDAYNIPTSTVTTVTVCANDQEFGTGSGANIKASPVESSALISLAITAGTCTGVDVTTTATEGVATFTYQTEKTSASLESNVATVTLTIADAAGGSTEQIYVAYDAPIDVEPGSGGAWTSVDMSASGSPADAKAIYVEAIAPSGTQRSWGMRRNGDSATPYGDTIANGMATGIEKADASGDIEVQVEDLTYVSVNAVGYFADSTLLTLADAPATEALTCDGTWNTITETGNVLVVYRVPTALFGNDIAIAYDSAGITPSVDTYYNQYIYAGVNAAGNVLYNCPASGGVTSLERVMEVATNGVVQPVSDDFNQLQATGTSAEYLTPSSTEFPCADGCYAFVVYVDASDNDRYNIGTTTADVAASDNVGNQADRFQIVKADHDGDPNGRFAVNVNDFPNTYFNVVAAIPIGGIPATAPTIIEISACAGTTDLDGLTPATTVHGTNIFASDTTVQCDAGDIDMPAGESWGVRTGTQNWTADFKVEEASGTLQVDLGYDARTLYAYDVATNVEGMKCVLNFDSGTYYCASNTPSQAKFTGTATLPSLISAEGDAFVRIESIPNSPTTQVLVNLYVSAAAITSQDTPVATGTYVGGDAHTGVIQFRQSTSALEFGIAAQSLTLTSTAQVDSTAITPPTVTPTVDGQDVTLTWPATAGTKWHRILRDTTTTPTTVVTGAEGLASTATSYQEIAPAAGVTYYYRVVFVDSSGNEAQSADITATTGTPNNAPTVTSPGAATVPYGVDYPSDLIVLDVVSICTGVDADSDPIYASTTTQPTNGTVALRTNSELVDYTHNQGQSAADSFVVTLKDDNGAESGNCTINVTPEGPPFIEPIMMSTTRSTSGEKVSYTVVVVPHGEELISFDESGQNQYQVMTGTGVTTTVTCPRANAYTCGELKLYLEQDNYGQKFTDLPPIGDEISVMLISQDEISGAGNPASGARGVVLQQE